MEERGIPKSKRSERAKIRKEIESEEIKCKCSDIFTKEEIKHLEEVLHGDLDGYHEELKDVGLDDEFYKWKNFSNVMLKKCDLNEWSIPKNV